MDFVETQKCFLLIYMINIVNMHQEVDTHIVQVNLHISQLQSADFFIWSLEFKVIKTITVKRMSMLSASGVL